MSTINGKACVANGTPVDKVFINGRQVYGRNLILGSSLMSGWPTRRTLKIVPGSMNGINASAATQAYASASAHVLTNANMTYLFSAYMYSSGGARPSMTVFIREGNDPNSAVKSSVVMANSGKIDSTVTRYSCKIQGLPAGEYLLDIEPDVLSDGSTVYTERWQLEEGTELTPWTPAPEDVM